MDTLRKDISFALRAAKSPGFVAIIVATLGLGIGANVAIFTVVDGMMLEAPPTAMRAASSVSGTPSPRRAGTSARSARSTSTTGRSATAPSTTWRSFRVAAST